MTQFIARGSTGRIHFAVQAEARPMPANGFIYHQWDEPVVLTQPRVGAELHWIDDAPQWVDTASIEELRAAAITAIDSAGEALRLAVVNRMPMQTEEYRRVETLARAWAMAGYPEDKAPRSVSAWSNAKHRSGWTARQAADDILTTADAWNDILDTIRELRLAKKEDVRHAGADEIAPIVASMTTSMRALAEQLNLSLLE